jgi:hypothetical protein
MDHSGFSHEEETKNASCFAIRRRCPACKYPHIRRACRRGKVDKILAVFNIYPFRCTNYECNYRFMRMARY